MIVIMLESSKHWMWQHTAIREKQVPFSKDSNIATPQAPKHRLTLKVFLTKMRRRRGAMSQKWFAGKSVFVSYAVGKSELTNQLNLLWLQHGKRKVCWCARLKICHNSLHSWEDKTPNHTVNILEGQVKHLTLLGNSGPKTQRLTFQNVCSHPKTNVEFLVSFVCRCVWFTASLINDVKVIFFSLHHLGTTFQCWLSWADWLCESLPLCTFY